MSEPTKEQVQKWYNSFVNKLHEEGISDENPMSLCLIRIYNDINYNEFHRLDISEEISDNQKAVNMGKGILKMPFLNQLNNYNGEDYAGFLYNNMKKTSELTDEEKLALYKAAQNNQLIIQSIEDDTSYFYNSKFVKINSDGNAIVSNNFNKISKENCANFGFDENTFDEVEEIQQKRDNAIKETNALVHAMTNSIDEKYSNLGISNLEERNRRTAKAEQEKKQIESENQWLLCEHDMLIEAYYHPAWFKDENTRKVVNDTRNLSKKSVLTEIERQFLNDNNNIILDLPRDIKKYSNARTWNEVKALRFADSNGKVISTDNEYNFYTELSKSFLSNEQVYINGMPCYMHEGGYGIKNCAPKKAYIDEVDSLISELGKTDSILSDDSDDYKKFAAGLKTLRENIKNAKGSNMGFEALDNYFETARALGKNYQESHKGKENLSSRQRARLRVINKLNTLHDKLKNKDMNPKPSHDEIILEKLVHGTFISCQKTDKKEDIEFGMNGQLNYEEYKKARENLRKNKFYQRLINNLNPKQKELLAKKRTIEVAREFYIIATKPEIEKEPKNIVNNDFTMIK